MLRNIFLVVVFAISVYFLNDYMNGCKYKSEFRLDDKVVIVTGANTGIGKETVIDLVVRGATVFMACRSLERAQAAKDDILNQTGVADERLVVKKLDLSSLESIRAFAKEFKYSGSRLDILINNAGIMFLPERKETVDGFELTFGTNHLGHFLLTNLLAETLVASAPSRVVTVSSIGHQWATMDFDDINMEKEYSVINSYTRSKLANVLFAKELAKRLEGTGVTSVSLHPGAIVTELDRHLPLLSNPYFRKVFYFFAGVFYKDPYHGAKTNIYCAVDPNVLNANGKYFSDCAVKTSPNKEAANEEYAKKLWDISADMVKLTYYETVPELRK